MLVVQLGRHEYSKSFMAGEVAKTRTIVQGQPGNPRGRLDSCSAAGIVRAEAVRRRHPWPDRLHITEEMEDGRLSCNVTQTCQK